MELTTAQAPTLADLEAARARIAGIARVTPVYPSETLSRLAGRDVQLKAENLQRVIYHHDRTLPAGSPRWQTLDEETTTIESVSSPISGGSRDLYLRGFVGEVEHFLRCVVGGSVPTSSAADNVATMALCDRILDAIGAR